MLETAADMKKSWGDFVAMDKAQTSESNRSRSTWLTKDLFRMQRHLELPSDSLGIWVPMRSLQDVLRNIKQYQAISSSLVYESVVLVTVLLGWRFYSQVGGGLGPFFTCWDEGALAPRFD